MGEIEQLIDIEGLPAIDKKDTDSCCEHAPIEGFECDWRIERIILPELGGDGSEDDGLESRDGADRRLTEAYDEVNSGGTTTQDLVAGDVGNLGLLALQIGFPILKPFLEEQVRRATVSVHWKEGQKDRGFDVIQYLVAEQGASLDPTAVEPSE